MRKNNRLTTIHGVKKKAKKNAFYFLLSRRRILKIKKQLCFTSKKYTSRFMPNSGLGFSSQYFFFIFSREQNDFLNQIFFFFIIIF